MFLPPSRGSVESNAVQEAYHLVELANDYFDKGDYAEAVTNFEKAVPVLRDVDDEYVLRCEYCMAICYGYLGRIDAAIAVSLRVESQNQQYDPMILSEPELADLFQRLGRLYLLKWKRLRHEDSDSLDADLCAEDAKVYLRKYLHMCQSGSGGGDLSRQLDAFRRFAAFFYSIGDYQSACTYYTSALQLAQRLHIEPVQLHCSTCIANSLVALGRLSDAIDTYKATLDFAMQTAADKAIQAQCTYRLGCALILVHRYSDAILYFLAHERIASDLGDLEGRLHSLDRLISAYRGIGDYAEANKYSSSKDLLLMKNSDSGTANEMTCYSHDQTMRSNISAVEQNSQLSGMQPVADSFDNLASRTFDSGQGISGDAAAPTSQAQTSLPRMYSFAFIDDGSTGPSTAPSMVDVSEKVPESDNNNNNSNKAAMERPRSSSPPPPPPPFHDPPVSSENVAVTVVVEQPVKLPEPVKRVVIVTPHSSSTGPQEPFDNVNSSKSSKSASKNHAEAKTKPAKHHKNETRKSALSKSKRASTLPPEDPEFLDLLTRVSIRRLDDQRAQLKPLPILNEDTTKENSSSAAFTKTTGGSSIKSHRLVEAVVESRENQQPNKPPPSDDLFVMVAKAQARRLDDQRAVLRPLPIAPNNRSLGLSPDIQLVKSGDPSTKNGAAYFSASTQNVTTSPASISLMQQSGSSKGSKARRFLSQLMK